MSTTFTLDTATSRATPTPAPMKRLTVPGIAARKGGVPLVMLTAYTARMAQLLDAHCDLLLVGDSLGQVIYGLDTTVKVTLDMMCAHGAAVVRGSYHSVVVVDLPFGSYESGPAQAFDSAARVLRETGAAGVKLEGGAVIAPTIRFLVERGVPVIGHVGLTPQAINVLGGYGARGRSEAEAAKILGDARAVAEAGRLPSSSRVSSSRWGAPSPRPSAARPSVSARPPRATARCWSSTTCSACSSARRASSAGSTISPPPPPMPAQCATAASPARRNCTRRRLSLALDARSIRRLASRCRRCCKQCLLRRSAVSRLRSRRNGACLGFRTAGAAT